MSMIPPETLITREARTMAAHESLMTFFRVKDKGHVSMSWSERKEKIQPLLSECDV